MFETIDATRFDRLMSNGKTKPALFTCQKADGTDVEVIAKFSNMCTYGGLIREAMAAFFALDLGLPVPEPFVVRLSPEFIDTIPNATVKTMLNASGNLGFGSKRLPDGFAQWIAPEGPMSSVMDLQSLEILTFDCWLANPDRHVLNHNLLSNGKSFAIFDHELALMYKTLIFYSPPWVPNSLEGLKPPQDHVFYKALRSRAEYDLGNLVSRLAALSDEKIGSYVSMVPSNWMNSDESATDAEAFVIQLRDNAVAAVDELKRALA